MNVVEAIIDVEWRSVWINLVSDVPSLASMLQTSVLIRLGALLGMLMGLVISKYDGVMLSLLAEGESIMCLCSSKEGMVSIGIGKMWVEYRGAKESR